ncbi:MAG TPA: TlpA disulfide reductase family protein [Alphaproteobacteria bacterium]|nr:TlpA disulfide reductase family protein [Alphaproteobacteria bacterium]
MPLTPKTRILLMLGAMLGAALLSYTILTNIQPSDTKNMETEAKKAPEMAREMPAAQPPVGKRVTASADLAPVTFYDAAGNAVTLADFKGQVLLVNLWATWCPPCIAELPSLDLLQAKLRDAGLKVVAISMDRKPVAEVAAFLEARNVEQMDLYIDTDREITLKWAYEALPASYLIDRDGRVLEIFMGPREWTKGDVFQKIKSALKAPQRPAKL